MMDQLIPSIQKTAELVQEISAANAEQNRGVEQINAAIIQLDSVIQQNASASEEMASTSEELTAQSDQLATGIAYFTIDGQKQEIRLLPERTEVGRAMVHQNHPASGNNGTNGNGHEKPEVEELLLTTASTGDSGDELDGEFEEY